MDAGATQGQEGSSNPKESEKERVDRNMQELLEGVRVALPGVQAFFAFLLILPFQQAFASVTTFQRDVYFITLLATTLASIFLIGPSARHRARFREGDKKWVVITGNRLAETGIVFLGLAISGAILLITDVLFSLEAAIAASAGIGLTLGWIWFAAPGLRELRDKDDRRA